MNAAGVYATRSSRDGKYYCGAVLADLPDYDASADCDCRQRTKASGRCAFYINESGERVGCNCRFCMALDLEALEEKLGRPVGPRTLVNGVGVASLAVPKPNLGLGPKLFEFHCGQKYESVSSKKTRVCLPADSSSSSSRKGTCEACSHLNENYIARNYTGLVSG